MTTLVIPVCYFTKNLCVLTNNLMVKDQDKIINDVTSGEYKYGFYSDIETDMIPKGLDENVILTISAKKKEPEWLLEFRLKAFRHWQTMKMPGWANLRIPKIDFQDIIYYAAPMQKASYSNLDEIDPELKRTFDKLGIPLEEQKHLSGVAVDAVMDSISVKTTFRETLAESGIIFCSFSDAVKEYPELVKRYMGTVVPYTDNFFASLNSAVFSDGSFCYIPKGVRCPMELSTYFRINSAQTGQFERTLLVADEEAYVSYLEGCTAPMRDENQLHAAIVEIIAENNAEVKYSTVQNWYPGDKDGKGGIFNFVTKRGLCRGENSKISWTQIETGSAITWKYPSCILRGDNSTGEFYSVAVTNHHQQADTGTKMIHIGKNTKSTIVSKGISAGQGQNSYRGLVKVLKNATGARNFSQCDSLLLGDKCGAHTFPYIEVDNHSAIVEHEATTSKIGEDQIFYCNQRGISTEDAVGLIVNGYAREVINKLPMEFAVEAQKLLQISLEGSVG
jgi:Fe-S cluster assembly protein SufB